MNVLHVGKFYPPNKGGMETVLEIICDHTAQHVRNRVLVANDRSSTVEDQRCGTEVIRVATFCKIGSVSVCPTMPARLFNEDADIVVIHEPNPMALLAYFLARPAGRLVVWFHSEVIRPGWRYRVFYRPFFEFALSRASAVVVASPTLAASAPQLRNWQRKCVVVPYGIDPESTAETGARRRRAQEIRRTYPQPLVLFVGRLVPYKGADVLLDALCGTSAMALLVGEGPERPMLMRKAEALGLSDQVKFLGEVDHDELAALYHACDLLVLPSTTRQEAFGVVQIEAMARAKPVISCDLGTGVGWVNRDGETGFVVPPGDAQALRAAIQQLLADAGLRARMGANGAERVRTIFSADRMIDATLDLYRQTMAAPARTGMPSLGKRALDLLLAGLGLIVSAPLWGLLSTLIKIEDGGPVFFTQERVGRGGRTFRALKFRSMIPDAEAEVGAVQSRQNDPRVTRIGRLMRATAMDELPQLWNIFRGDMSFVGPRALRPGEIEVNGRGSIERVEDVPGFDRRCAVRPGLTGIAQIYAPRDVVRRHKFRYDRFYIRRQSLWLDVRLILLSFWISFRGTWEARGRKF
jgi:rhamnosyl/mannosyltransferase